MFHPDEPRRKIPSTTHLKNAFGSASHNLVSTLDKKRADPSKEKPRQITNELAQLDTKGSAVINFRQIKNSQQNNKLNKEFFQSKLTKKNSQATDIQASKYPSSILNVLSNKKLNLNDVHGERSLSQRKKEQDRGKKVKKVNKMPGNSSSVQDFQCNQQLQIRGERKTQKKIVPGVQNKLAIFQKPSLKAIKLKTEQNDAEASIRQFDLRQEQINNLGQSENICFLDLREISYKVDPLYIEKRQKSLTWLMRAILMDWMMHISYQFRLKRQTLHTALVLVDNFFQASFHLAKSDFQLTGAAALFIAAKLEEFEPLSSREFAKSTKQRYTAEEIRAMQLRMAKTLKFNLNPPTLSMWGNKVMQQWDSFLENTPMLQDSFFLGKPAKYFKKIDNDSYRNYRTVMQLLDCAILDIQTVQYKPKVLVVSLIYLVLGREFNQFSKKRIVTQFPRTSTFFLEDSAFNRMFSYFLRESFALEMREILPSVQYLASYFTLTLSYDRPLLEDEESIEKMGLEEYCSFQTYNASMVGTVEKRFRGIYE